MACLLWAYFMCIEGTFTVCRMSAMLSHLSSLFTKLSEMDLQQKISESGTFTKSCLAAASLYGTYQTVSLVYKHFCKHVNDKRRDVKRLENQKSIQELGKRLEQSSLSEAEVQRITRLPLSDLINELKSGKIRPINALRAYQTQALWAHEKTNCLVEAIVEAEERALELEKGQRDGLLWGVPLSIKDDVGIKGYDNTTGMVIAIGVPAKEDASMLKALLHHGAIPFVKTNVPQTELSFEPGNPINGIVRNPHELHHGPGGSSSGEAAIIASHGSPLGIGSDVCGSIRVPAHFCGIHGFKPTSERISYRNNVFDGPLMCNAYQGTWGPLSRDVDGLVLLMRALWEDCLINKMDPAVPWQPFDNEEYTSTRKLRIGYFMDTSFFPTFSACKRAVQETVDLLSDKGHELIAWQPPKFDSTMDIGFRILLADGQELKEYLKYDRIHSCMSDGFLKPHFLPTCLRRLLDIAISFLSPQTAENLALRVGPIDVLKYMELAHELVQFRRLVHDAWMDAKLDAVICPPNVMVAPPFGSSDLLLGTCIYTFFFNLMHYPAGVVHVTKVNQLDLYKLDTDYPDISNKRLQEAKAAMKSSGGLPVGVMVATPRYRDETCLRIMKLIEENKTK